MQMQVLDKRNILSEEVITYGDIENPIFLAKDVAIWIDHNKPNEMIMNVDEDEKLKAIVSHSGQNREMWFLTEDGLYEVLMLSRKPIARQFKKQVKKILKELRLQNNPYSNVSKEMKGILLNDKRIQAVETRVDDINEKFDNLPLLPANLKILKKLANKTVVPLLGGKQSNAYKKMSRKVFSDLYRQLHREFGIVGCEEIKRKDFELAKQVIIDYRLPRALESEINLINKIEDRGDLAC